MSKLSCCYSHISCVKTHSFAFVPCFLTYSTAASAGLRSACGLIRLSARVASSEPLIGKNKGTTAVPCKIS